MKPSITDTFIYNDQEVKAEWFDLTSKDELSYLPWKQVYAVANLNGMVPVVYYADGHFSLPGGSTEADETAEDTLCREIQEELNCRVLSWIPIGYQKNSIKGVDDGYQLRVYAEIEKIGEFESDPAGSVIGYKLIPISDLSKTLGWGKMSDHIQAIAESKI